MTATYASTSGAARWLTKGGLLVALVAIGALGTGCAAGPTGSPAAPDVASGGGLLDTTSESQQILLDGGREIAVALLDGPANPDEFDGVMAVRPTPEGNQLFVAGYSAEDVIIRLLTITLPSEEQDDTSVSIKAVDLPPGAGDNFGSVEAVFRTEGRDPAAAELLARGGDVREIHTAVRGLIAEMRLSAVLLITPRPDISDSAALTNCYVRTRSLDGEAGCLQYVSGSQMPADQDMQVRPVTPDGARSVVDTGRALVANIAAPEDGQQARPLDAPNVSS